MRHLRLRKAKGGSQDFAVSALLVLDIDIPGSGSAKAGINVVRRTGEL
jgi:hypothetical protein